MSLHDFSTDVIPIIQSVISLFGIAGLYLVWYQIKQTKFWNKLSTQHALLSDLPTEEQSRRFAELCTKYGGEKSVISKEKVANIYADLSERACIMSFLNKLEHICAAINTKTIDENYAYAFHAARVIITYDRLKFMIDHIREQQNNSDIFIELQKVAKRWSVRQKAESDTREKELQKLNEKRGAKPHIF